MSKIKEANFDSLSTDTGDFYDQQMDRLFWGKGKSMAKSLDEESRRNLLADELEIKLSPVNPSHYRNYIKDMQWLEAMQYIPSMREPKAFKAAVELQARKYLDRLGGKDAELQEVQKSIWYLKFLAAYIANDNSPIKVNDIPKILGE